MRVRFTKDYAQFRAGDETTVWNERGRQYIALGVAEAVQEKKEVSEPEKKEGSPVTPKKRNAGPGK